ncbi:MAG: MBL fold metallo-hydrolase [bacterium]|nr:MBL fold metallo-hydrolase [bacterium]
MFDIEYKGANTVVISTKKSVIVTDPKLSIHGQKDYVVKNAIELATEEQFSLADDDFSLSISYPGGYEVGDFSINGFPEKRHLDGEEEGKKSVIYSIEILNGVKVGLIGNVGPEISDEQLENLGTVDILILPVGGNGYTLDATSAAKIVRNVDPKVVIPVHYLEDGLNYEVPQGDLTTFIKELGADVEKTQKYKVKSLTSLPEKLTIVQVERTK